MNRGDDTAASIFSLPPAAIFFLGGEASDSVELLVKDRNGQETHCLLPGDSNVLPGDAFWEWKNHFPSDETFKTQGWKTLLTTEISLPLYLQKPKELFLLRGLPEHDAVYIRINGTINDDHKSINEFAEESLRLVKSRKCKDVIIDFRFNWGGVYNLTTKFTRNYPNVFPSAVISI